jgi:hypothetical protein
MPCRLGQLDGRHAHLLPQPDVPTPQNLARSRGCAPRSSRASACQIGVSSRASLGSPRTPLSPLKAEAPSHTRPVSGRSGGWMAGAEACTVQAHAAIDFPDQSLHNPRVAPPRSGASQLSGRRPIGLIAPHQRSDSRFCRSASLLPAESSQGKGYTGMPSYECSVCGWIYDETMEDLVWHELRDDWTCPVSG